MKARLDIAIALLIVSSCSGYAADWPQWQGPNRDRKSPDTDLLEAWPQAGPPLAWRIENLGGGDSAPSVAEGRIYGMANRDEQEIVWALSEKDGSEIWVTALGPAFRQRAGQGKEGPGCTPTVDGDRLYVVGLAGNIACLQADDGKLIWQVSMTEEFGGRVPMWSFRESPLIDGDRVICTPGGGDAALVALNKLTGATIWKGKVPAASASAEGEDSTGRPGGRGGRGGPGGSDSPSAAYSSVIAIDFEGQRQYVQLFSNTVAGFSASDGQFLWRYDKPANRMGINCSTPIYHDGVVFASSAYGAGAGLVKLAKGADGSIVAEEVFATSEMQSHHGGMVLLDGYLYGASGGNDGGAMVCLDFKTGEVKWDQRPTAGRRAKGSVILADGRLYYRMENGTVVLIEPSPAQYIECGRFEQPDRRKPPAWAHPVVANGKLYVRDQDVLFCYDVTEK